jgi:hypothetical protein
VQLQNEPHDLSHPRCQRRHVRPAAQQGEPIAHALSRVRNVREARLDVFGNGKRRVLGVARRVERVGEICGTLGFRFGGQLGDRRLGETHVEDITAHRHAGLVARIGAAS